MSKCKKIAYLVSQFPALSHTFILREMDALEEKGWQIHPFSINLPDREQLTHSEKKWEKRTFYVKQQGLLNITKSLFAAFFRHPLSFFKTLFLTYYLAGLNIKKWVWHTFYLAEAFLIGNEMVRTEVSHLHVHFANPAALVAFLLAQLYPITYSLTVHGPDEFYHVHEGLLKEKIEGAQFIIAISSFAQSQLMKVSKRAQWDKFVVVPLGVDSDKFFPSPFRQDPHPFRILSVGRLVPNKGQSILLEALKFVLQEKKEVELTLVGEGEDRVSLEELSRLLEIESHVHFAGGISQDIILDFYHKADLFVLASFAEGVPVVLMEAMSQEIACISTYVNGIPELIDQNINGLLVSPSDPVSLAKAIIELIENNEKRKLLGKMGREKVLQSYDLKKNIEKLEKEFIKRLC